MPSSSSVPNPSGQSNIFLLAADGSPRLLEVLRGADDPGALARSQDSTGYSLLHALASYDELELLRQVAVEFAVPPNLVDEDGETALFVVEGVAAAQCLVDEIGVDWRLRNRTGETAEEKIRTDGDNGAVADFLAVVRSKAEGSSSERAASASAAGDSVAGSTSDHPPPLPPGVKMEVGTMTADQLAELEPDPEFKRRIEELAARDDFQGDEGQAQLRQIVQDAVRGVGSEDRDVRQRTE